MKAKQLLFMFSLSALLLLNTQNVFSQVLISNTTGSPNSNAMLEIKSSDKGLLIPRITTANRKLITATPGLLVFDSDIGSFFLYGKTADGSDGWIDLSTDAGIWTRDNTKGNVFLTNSTFNVGIGTSSPKNKLVIQADNDSDTLLEILDKNGVPLMVVTPVLTRFNFVKPKKGVSGGFAVGRYATAKDGKTLEDTTSLFLVTEDSTRVYTTGSKVTSGGFAVGRYATAKGAPYVEKYFYTDIDSTRVYTGGGSAVTSGGFAVGRYATAKDAPYIKKYFFTDLDSTRIYIDESAAGSSGGFAVGRYATAKDGTKDYFNINASNVPEIINPSDARIFWYPLKEAFMSGKVLVESVDSVGQNSWASGFESKSIGDYSQALGYKARAFSDNSTAIGNYANAEGSESYAFGNHAYTEDEGSYAIGSGAQALGKFSFALGSIGLDLEGNTTSPTIADGDYAYAFGMGSVASDQGAFAFGTQDTASGHFSLATGYKTKASGFACTSMGSGTKTSGDICTAMGYFTIASDDYSTAMGEFTIANNEASTAMGAFTIASGISSTAMGQSTTASGSGSISMGWGSIASGRKTAAMGHYTTAQSYASVVLGRYNIIAGDSDNWIGIDPLFVIGNGTDDTHRSNVVTVLKNGNVGIGTLTPNQKLDVNGNICLSGGDRIIESSSGFIDLRPHDGTYGLILRNYTGSNTVWSNFRTIDATTDYLHIAMNSISTSEGLIISDNGNVGIGTTTPLYKLYVNGEIASGASNAFRLRNSSYGTILRNDNSNFYVLFTNNGDPDGSWNTLRPFRINLSSGDVMLGNNSFYVKHGGYVGVGITTPTERLDVNGFVRTTGINGRYSDSPMIRDHNNANVTVSALGGGLYLGYYNTQNLFFYTGSGSGTGSAKMTLSSAGRLGIGTTFPSFPLHVESYVNSNFSYGYLNSGGHTGTNTATVAVSIYAQHRIRAEEFDADSDERIKRKLKQSDSEKDLELLKNIKITDYKYVDTVSKGNKIYKKVIAQELQKVYPRAVSVTSGFIPSVYAKAKSVKYDENTQKLIIETANSHEFKAGDEVKLIYKDGVLKPKVTDVISDNVFAVESDKSYDEIFVFGKKVDDFLTVDYEAIAMLNVSAVQELIRKIEEQNKKINEFKKQNSEIEQLKQQIQELKQLIQNK